MSEEISHIFAKLHKALLKLLHIIIIIIMAQWTTHMGQVKGKEEKCLHLFNHLIN